MAKQRLSISLESDLYDALAEEAEESGRSLADVVRDKLRQAVLGEERREGVGELAEKLIREGLPNEEVLFQIQREIPDAQTSDASVRWYRSQMRKRGEDVPTQVEARRNFRN